MTRRLLLSYLPRFLLGFLLLYNSTTDRHPWNAVDLMLGVFLTAAATCEFYEGTRRRG